jgi:nucleoid-associated protein YgaU
MAARKQRNTTHKEHKSKQTVYAKSRKVTRAKQYASQNSLLDYFRFGESYTSLILGIVVVIVTTILVISTIRDRNLQNSPKKETSSLSTSRDKEIESDQLKEEVTYRVKEGDTLWSIAEKEYNNGYHWTLIAQANKVQNPDLIEVGELLVIPSDSNTYDQQTTQENTLNPPTWDQKETSRHTQIKKYIVKRGDYLWAIAEKEYNNGYRWVDIARANNLANPNIIHAGNELIIPDP